MVAGNRQTQKEQVPVTLLSRALPPSSNGISSPDGIHPQSINDWEGSVVL